MPLRRKRRGCSGQGGGGGGGVGGCVVVWLVVCVCEGGTEVQIRAGPPDCQWGPIGPSHSCSLPLPCPLPPNSTQTQAAPVKQHTNPVGCGNRWFFGVPLLSYRLGIPSPFPPDPPPPSSPSSIDQNCVGLCSRWCTSSREAAPHVSMMALRLWHSPSSSPTAPWPRWFRSRSGRSCPAGGA